jgi:hypothetical protein
LLLERELGAARQRAREEDPHMTRTYIRVAAAAMLGAFVALPAQAQSSPPASGMNPAKPMAPAQSMAPSPTMAPAQPMAGKKAPSAGRLAAQERQKACSAEWKSAKAGGKMEPGMKWPKFWSECNTRLKAKSV